MSAPTTPNWFATRRHELNRTQHQIAVASGVHVQTVIAWEQFKLLPKLIKLDDLVHAYEVEADTIIREVGNAAKHICKCRLTGKDPNGKRSSLRPADTTKKSKASASTT